MHMWRHPVRAIFDILFIILFIILFAIGSGYRFNYLHLIFHDSDIAIYHYVILGCLLVALFIYNKYIAILYGILAIAQVRRMVVSYFVSGDMANPEYVLKQLKSRLDFDTTKSPLAKQVILDIYNKYFVADINPTLKEIATTSASYSAVSIEPSKYK